MSLADKAMKVSIKFVADGANLNAFLAGAANAMTGLNMKARDLHGTLGRLAIFAATGGAGVAILRGFKGPLDEASKMQVALTKFAQFGMDEKINAAAERYARATKVMGASTLDMMNYMIEAQGVFRGAGETDPAKMLTGAKIMAPLLAQIHFAQSALGRGEMTEADDRNMLRFIEDRGGATDPNKATAIADMGYKLINSSGGLVKWADLQSLITRSAALGRTMSDQGIAKLEPIMAAMTGSTTGSGLRTAYNRMMGFQRLIPKMAIDEFIGLGLWDGSKIERNSQGGVKKFNGNPLVDSTLEGSDPVSWYTKYFLPAVQKKYGNGVAYGTDSANVTKREREINLIFGGGSTGATVYTRIDQMLPNILRSIETQKKALGIKDSDKAADATLAGKQIELQKNWQTLMLQMGEVILPTAIRAMTGLNGVLQSVGSFVTAHPTMFKVIVAGIAALGVALTGIGAFGFIATSIAAIAGLFAGGGVVATIATGVAAVIGGGGALAALGAGIWAFFNFLHGKAAAVAKPPAAPKPAPAPHPAAAHAAVHAAIHQAAKDAPKHAGLGSIFSAIGQWANAQVEHSALVGEQRRRADEMAEAKRQKLAAWNTAQVTAYRNAPNNGQRAMVQAIEKWATGEWDHMRSLDDKFVAFVKGQTEQQKRENDTLSKLLNRPPPPAPIVNVYVDGQKAPAKVQVTGNPQTGPSTFNTARHWAAPAHAPTPR